MDKNIKRLEEKIDNIERRLSLPGYSLKNCLDARIKFDLKLYPILPTTTIQDIHISQIETRIKVEIYSDLKRIEDKINSQLRYI